MKNIAIIGSSGGNLYNLGGKNPRKLLDEIKSQCHAANFNIAAIQFIASEVSMDQAKANSKTSLFSLDEEGQIIQSATNTLEKINEQAKQTDEEIAAHILNKTVDGLIVMSADAEHVNQKVVNAAVGMGIPIVGTGGTSMATISAKGANVIAKSGTTGTTNRTRAISFVAAMAKFWGIKYKPTIGNTNKGDAENSGSIWKNINIRGIMVSALPGFIAMALVLALSKIPLFSGLQDIFDIMIGALPIVIAVIAAKQVSNLDEVSIVAGVIAGVLSVDGGIIGGIIGGILAGIFVHYFFQKCISWKFPMTTVNIVTGGIAGLLAGLLVYFLFAPIALFIGDGIKTVIEAAIGFSPILAGLLGGLLIWPAILGGIYHAAILPIVLLEMEKTGVSFLGAIDMVGLVMVSAGINLANIIAPREKGEAAAATPGFLINMGFGTFVEAAYPFMFSNKIVFAGAILSAGVGGALVGLFDVRGTAYVPTFTTPFLSDNPLGFVIAMLASFMLTFAITLIANKKKRVEEVRDKGMNA
ncbi:PTS sugar transporter [Oceanobacillus sojae]|uniref:PTS sugar transporter n=1 Tax=Oceanobacillus sojae TaxID=582851 RepID=UPI0021A8D742|nr:PTS sugar transporter [Oceanobacillus sojae]MCT1903066.1 PTS sugar transporter [Oceanobacillus sojae]